MAQDSSTASRRRRPTPEEVEEALEASQAEVMEVLGRYSIDEEVGTRQVTDALTALVLEPTEPSGAADLKALLVDAVEAAATQEHWSHFEPEEGDVVH